MVSLHEQEDSYPHHGDREGFTKEGKRARVYELIHKEKGYKSMMDDLQNGPTDAPAGDEPTDAPAEPTAAPEAAPEEAAPQE